MCRPMMTAVFVWAHSYRCSARLLTLLSKPEKHIKPTAKAHIMEALSEFTSYFGAALSCQSEDRLKMITDKAIDMLREQILKQQKQQSSTLMAKSIECLSVMASHHDISTKKVTLNGETMPAVLFLFKYVRNSLNKPDVRLLEMPRAGLIFLARQSPLLARQLVEYDAVRTIFAKLVEEEDCKYMFHYNRGLKGRAHEAYEAVLATVGKTLAEEA